MVVVIHLNTIFTSQGPGCCRDDFILDANVLEKSAKGTYPLNFFAVRVFGSFTNNNLGSLGGFSVNPLYTESITSPRQSRDLKDKCLSFMVISDF